MIGTYTIPQDKLNEMKGAFRFNFIKFIIIIYIVFVAVIFAQNEPDMLSSLLLVTGFFGGILCFFLIVNAFRHRPLYNTIIQLTENEIIRRGEDLRTVRLRYDEIGYIYGKDIGTVLVKKGILPTLDLWTTKRRPYSNTSGVILIPLSIESYQKIVSYVKERAK